MPDPEPKPDPKARRRPRPSDRPVRELALPRGTFDEDGRLVVDPPDPSPIGKMRPSQKVKRMLGILEAAASAGDVAAARDWLAFHKWQVEMRKGRAPQRVAVAAVGALTLNDSLGAIPTGETGRLLLTTLASACGADPDRVVDLIPRDPGKGNGTPETGRK